MEKKGVVGMGDYDDDRPDWREIDRKKDRSGFYGRQDKSAGAGIRERPKDRWKAGRVREALDRIFLGDKGTPEHDKLYAKLHSTYGSERFLPTVRKYIQKYGLPDDAPTLILVIDTKEQEIIFSVLDKLSRIYPELPPRHKQDVKSKLSILAMTDRSREVRQKAAAMMEEMA
jgi:hypothetical protein